MHQGAVRVRVRAGARARAGALTPGAADATAVVLAGGRSSRFGRDKLGEPIGGEPMLHHAIRRAAEVCRAVVVVLAPGGPEPPMPADVPVRFARDSLEGEGPLEGAHAGLLAVSTELAVLVAGDMPELVPAVLDEMLAIARERSADAVVLRDGERLRPLPSVVRVAPAVARAETLLHGGHRRLRELLGALDPAVVEEAAWHALDPERRTLVDVDEPRDLDG
ncbi:MAG TPA: molybdenum cofactor guanylyltransferase [Actinomycetota bacterium]|nr:molybdenum cofactor guanylyltransferase [Actinomycetota bacterium]